MRLNLASLVLYPISLFNFGEVGSMVTLRHGFVQDC